jgi:hypothetical protein
MRAEEADVDMGGLYGDDYGGECEEKAVMKEAEYMPKSMKLMRNSSPKAAMHSSNLFSMDIAQLQSIRQE